MQDTAALPATTTKELASDADDLLLEAARRDPAAFQLVYERHAPAVYRYLRARMLGDEDAADLTATTFERALGAVTKYRPSTSGPRPFLLPALP